MNTAVNVELQFIRKPDVCTMVAASDSTVSNLLNPKSKYYDPSFPQPVRLSDHGRAVAWLKHEVEAWIGHRAAKRHIPCDATQTTPCSNFRA